MEKKVILLSLLILFISGIGMAKDERVTTTYIENNLAKRMNIGGVDEKMLPYRIAPEELETPLPISRRPDSYPNYFKAETTGYGQLKDILEKNKGNDVDSLVVVGPINDDDITAIWKCACSGNMLVLNLEEAKIKNNIIPDGAFSRYIEGETTRHFLNLRRIILPEGIESIGVGAFSIMLLEEINIPSSVRKIGSSAFYMDRLLNCKIVIPEGVTEIGDMTFYQCFSLKEAPVLPSTIKRIGVGAFASTNNDDGAWEMEFPSGLKEIGMQAFLSGRLKRVNLPASCEVLGVNAFSGNVYLEEVSLSPNIEVIPWGCFYMCENIKQITLPEKCKVVELRAFEECTGLEEVNFNYGLEVIKELAFTDTSVKTFTLPPTLKELGEGCFNAIITTRFENIKCAAIEPPTCQKGVFDAAMLEENPPTLYVPTGCKEAYASAYGWNYFTNIVETDDFPWAGVSEVRVEEENNSPMYDLYGRKVTHPQPGTIYIQGGKKVIYPVIH